MLHLAIYYDARGFGVRTSDPAGGQLFSGRGEQHKLSIVSTTVAGQPPGLLWVYAGIHTEVSYLRDSSDVVRESSDAT